ncbi:MAG: polysaccharide deacetylase [Clostridia bacterium]|nr:polysaccharide deacetylase [Clostridia bacterium]
MNEEVNEEKPKKLNYKRVLLVIVIVIIMLLVIIFAVVIKNNNKTEQIRIEADKEAEEEIMKIAIETQKKEEEEHQREKEKQEEENATGIIYLTFDDGPTSDSTPQILDILKSRNIKATFFILHYDEQHEQFIKREQQEGHTIGLHGYTHNYSEIYQSAETCIENFEKIGNQVYQTTGEKSKFIRFPGGSSNTISKKYCEGVMTELVNRVIELGYNYFDWNVDSDDAGHAKTSQDIYNNVISGIKPERRNVVLMHDFAENYKTIDALDSIISWGLEQGYVFRKITDETPMVKHGVNN